MNSRSYKGEGSETKRVQEVRNAGDIAWLTKSAIYKRIPRIR